MVIFGIYIGRRKKNIDDSVYITYCAIVREVEDEHGGGGDMTDDQGYEIIEHINRRTHSEETLYELSPSVDIIPAGWTSDNNELSPSVDIIQENATGQTSENVNNQTIEENRSERSQFMGGCEQGAWRIHHVTSTISTQLCSYSGWPTPHPIAFCLLDGFRH